MERWRSSWSCPEGSCGQARFWDGIRLDSWLDLNSIHPSAFNGSNKVGVDRSNHSSNHRFFLWHGFRGITRPQTKAAFGTLSPGLKMRDHLLTTPGILVIWVVTHVGDQIGSSISNVANAVLPNSLCPTKATTMSPSCFLIDHIFLLSLSHWVTLLIFCWANPRSQCHATTAFFLREVNFTKLVDQSKTTKSFCLGNACSYT
jgi:hypothetical protein